jgi:hypothetical protein
LKTLKTWSWEMAVIHIHAVLVGWESQSDRIDASQWRVQNRKQTPQLLAKRWKPSSSSWPSRRADVVALLSKEGGARIKISI